MNAAQDLLLTVGRLVAVGLGIGAVGVALLLAWVAVWHLCRWGRR